MLWRASIGSSEGSATAPSAPPAAAERPKAEAEKTDYVEVVDISPLKLRPDLTGQLQVSLVERAVACGPWLAAISYWLSFRGKYHLHLPDKSLHMEIDSTEKPTQPSCESQTF